jgi:5-methylcytosine-specific restriction endonuclease McrA
MASGWIGKATRQAIYERDGASCVYCGANDQLLSLDHLECRSWGGALKDPKNLVTACHSCNSARSDMTIPQFQRYLNAKHGLKTKGLARKIKRLTSKPVIVNGKNVAD